MNDVLLEAVLRGVMGGGRKRSKKAFRYLTGSRGGSLVNANTLLTAAGVAWGIFETMQQAPPPAAPTAPAPTAAPSYAGAGGGLPPLPTLRATDDTTRMVRLAVSAANADGTMSEQERASILQHAGAAADVVAEELDQRRPLAEIVAGVTDPAQRATLYVLAFTIVRADEQVSGAERIYLAQLAHLLNLDPTAVQTLEKDATARIDKAGE
jgi:uncharacterized membrane protein YebE (DUF533 family)